MGGVVPAREVHRAAVAVLGPTLLANGFSRVRTTSVAAWQRPSGDEFIVAWVQPSRSADPFGWYGTSFTIEFRRSDEPRIGTGGASAARLCGLLGDAARERVRQANNDVVRKMPRAPRNVLRQLPRGTRDWYKSEGNLRKEPYGPDEDVWFRHRDSADLDAWMRILSELMADALVAVQQRLG
jgi:hypothetical protein